MITKSRGYGVEPQYVDTYPTHPPEPVEFVRLVRHLEGSTVPLPAACRSGGCRQGRDVCPTPLPCQCADVEFMVWHRAYCRRLLAAAIVVVLLCAAAAVLLP